MKRFAQARFRFLSIEPLESRRLLAVDLVTRGAEHAFATRGTEHADAIEEGMARSELEVSFNNVTERFDAPHVQKPRVSGLGGDDSSRGDDSVAVPAEILGGKDGGVGNDKLSVDNGSDDTHGGQANDSIIAGNGDDSDHGDDGADAINGGQGNDYLSGDNGKDSIHDTVGDDSNDGGAKDENLVGERGIDLVHGGGVEDWTNDGLDDDMIFGDDGNDHAGGDDGNEVDLSDELMAFLSDASDAKAQASFESDAEHGVLGRKLMIDVLGALPEATLEVVVDGRSLGSVPTDAQGNGSLVFSTHPKSGQQPLPEDLEIFVGSTVRIGDTLVGSFTSDE